jgi:D-arabinitol 4-dehydrogenase
MSVVNIDHGSSVLYRTAYDKSECRAGVVHIGYGAFHRAHQAIYFDDYMEKTGDLSWGIVAVNLRAEESAAFEHSSQVDEGYIIKTIDADTNLDYRLVRSHLDYVDWSASTEKAESVFANRDIHLVTITVTESGYYLDGNGDLDLDEDIIASEITGGVKRSIYGFLASALERRKNTIDQSISILCCDNIRANGKMLRKNFLAYLKACNQEDLHAWVSEKASFPCSMVDRITPRASSELESEIGAAFGSGKYDPIHSEAFSQWVIENRFAGHFPDLAKAGAEIVADVDPYEETKIRILNGGHTSLAYLGALAGYTTFDEAMRDDQLREHFDQFETEEVLPGLQLELPFDKHEYLKKVTARFCNSAIADQLERICMDGYSKMQLYIRPTIQSCMEQGITPFYSMDTIASWYVFARRHHSGKMRVNYIEPYMDQLVPMLAEGMESEFASNAQLWGGLPEHFNDFTPLLLEAIHRMEQRWLD